MGYDVVLAVCRRGQPSPQGRLVEASAEEQSSRELAGTYSAQTTR